MNRSVFKLAAGWLLASAMVIPLAGQQLMAQEKKAAAPAPKLKVGDVAPDFKLQYFDGNDLKDVSLSDYKGKKNVVLAFYIFAFTGG
jgi:AhpC/TSA family